MNTYEQNKMMLIKDVKIFGVAWLRGCAAIKFMHLLNMLALFRVEFSEL